MRQHILRRHAPATMRPRKQQCCVALGFGDSECIGSAPVVLLDDVVFGWSREGVAVVNDV